MRTCKCGTQHERKHAYCHACHREYSQRWRDNNLEKNRSLQRDYSKRNRPRRIVATAAWKRTENGRRSNVLKSQRYRARKAGAEGSHTQVEWDTLLDKCGHVCVECRKTSKLTKDHIVPLSKGGSDYIENIQPLCGPCNSRKGNS